MSLGLDPELFVVKKGARQATSIHLLDFEQTYVYHDGNPVQTIMKPDGFAFEFNLDKPSNCRDYIVPSLANGVRHFYRQYPGYELSAKTTMRLTNASVQGDTPEGVCDYGCIPDSDAYSLKEKTPPRDSYHNTFRYVGGHLHTSLLGFPDPTNNVQRGKHISSPTTRELIAGAHVLAYDLMLGLPMVAMLGTVNDYGEARRRTYYGQAGSHRVKPYGVEYRVLSSMVMSSPYVLTWALGQLRSLGNWLTMEILPWTPWHQHSSQADERIREMVGAWFQEYDLHQVARIINEHDVAAANAYLDEKPLLQPFYRPEFVRLMRDADKKGIPLSTNMAEAWRIDKEIKHHSYPGVENLISSHPNGPHVLWRKKQFPPFVLHKGPPKQGW